MAIKNRHLVIFALAGIIVMTFLVLNMEVRKEVRTAIQEKYEKGEVPEEDYKKALSDGKLSYWEAMTLK